MEKQCNECGKIFRVKPSHFQKRFNCSKQCFDKSRLGKIKKCKKCNKSFYVIRALIKRKNYCSLQCLRSFKTGFYRKCYICKKEFYIYASQKRIKCCSLKCAGKYVSKMYSGKNSFQWKGGRTVDGQGYVDIFKPDHPRANTQGYIEEHTLIMEKKIKRFLSDEELVHHLDSNPSNNKLSNLYLCENESEHQRLHAGWWKEGGVWWKKCNGCKRNYIVNNLNFFKKYDSHSTRCKKCSNIKNHHLK